MGTCGIYKIQNIKSNQIYIGQSINIEDRIERHKRIPDNFDIHKAMANEGINNFSFEIIEECPQELLNEREKHWISFYDSYNNGYNMTSGGAGAPNTNDKKVKQYSLEGDFIREYNSEREAAIALNTDARYISNCCLHKNNTILNYQFCFPGDEDSIQKMPKQNPGYEKIAVSKYSLDGKFICNYDSILDASKEHHNDTKGISNCCKKKSLSAQGFLWTYKGDTAPEPYDNKKAHATNSRRVKQYDLQGKYIKTYNSCLEAALDVGLKGSTCIIRCCKGMKKQTAGYKWEYADAPK